MEMKTIEYLLPKPTPEPVGIVVPVSERGLEDGREFVAKYLGDHPRISDMAEGDLDLMAASFLTLMGSLPIRNDELVRWVAETAMYDGGRAIAEYAEKVLGMDPVEAPVRGGGRQRHRMAAAPRDKYEQLEQAMEGASVQDVGNVLYASFDHAGLHDIVGMIQDMIEHIESENA